MEVIDYNGDGRWSCQEVIARYRLAMQRRKLDPRDLSPGESTENGRRRVYPVMHEVIKGIEAGDPGCIEIGLEFIEEDAKFPFGKTLKSNTARALRRADLSEPQKRRVRRRVFGLLGAGHIPHEYREYAKLLRKVGFAATDIPAIDSRDRYVIRFHDYFERNARPGS